MHPYFKYLMRANRDRGMNVIDRCNLTILDVDDYRNMAEFLAAQQVSIDASLPPCYLDFDCSGLHADTLQSKVLAEGELD